MGTYEVSYRDAGSGSGIIHEVVTSASEYNARRPIAATFSGQSVSIYSVRTMG